MLLHVIILAYTVPSFCSSSTTIASTTIVALATSATYSNSSKNNASPFWSTNTNSLKYNVSTTPNVPIAGQSINMTWSIGSTASNSIKPSTSTAPVTNPTVSMILISASTAKNSVKFSTRTASVTNLTATTKSNVSTAPNVTNGSVSTATTITKSIVNTATNRSVTIATATATPRVSIAPNVTTGAVTMTTKRSKIIHNRSSSIIASTNTAPNNLNQSNSQTVNSGKQSTISTPLNSTADSTLIPNMTVYSNLPHVRSSTTTFGNYMNFDMSCFTFYCIIERFRRDNYKQLLHLSLFLGIIGFIGGIGNAIVIMVFARNQVKKTSTYFMLTLAIIDFMVCVIVIPGVIAREWKYRFYTDVLCKGLEFMRSLMIPASALILVAIAFDRFFLICMSTKEVMTKFTTRIVIFAIMIIGMALGIPPSLFVSVYIKDGDKMQNYQICMRSDKYMDDIAQYQYWYFVTALFGIMTCTILVLYSLIFKKVLQQSRMWKNRRPKIFPQRRNTAGAFEDIHINRKTSAPEAKVLEISTTSTAIPSVNLPTTQDPCTSGINNKTLKARNSKQTMVPNSSSTNIKTLSDIRKRSTHVKTTRILFIVTLVYIFSFLPSFLETNEVLEPNKYLTHVYFVNNAANPIIYSFMNAKFREEARRMYCKCIK